MPSVVTNDGTRSSTVTDAVDQPDHAGGHQAQQQSAGNAGMPASVREVHDERRKREHHAGRQVDLAADHQHDLAARDDGRRAR